MELKDLNENVSISNSEEFEDNRFEQTPEVIESYDANELEDVPDFEFYDKDWTEELDEKFLDAKPLSEIIDGFKPESVCGVDNRTRITNTTASPWKMICKIFGTTSAGGRYMASGFFISPRCIITNGHVVYPNGNWGRNLQVIPGMNGNIAPFGRETGAKLYSVVGWTRDGNSQYDYGAIILPNNNLYNRVKATFGYRMFGSNVTLNNCGYPGDKPMGTAWYNAGKPTRTTERMFHYMIDTAGGQSGSPVWGSSRTVAGVHGYGGCPNKAVRVIPDVMKNWNSWRSK